MAKIERTGGRIPFKIGDSEKLYIKRDVVTETDGDVKERVWMPSPFNGTFLRFVSDTLFLHEFISKSGEGRVILSCKAGGEFIPISISKDETISISVSHMIGFTSKVRFTRYMNLSLAAICCDRTFTTIASGPGTLVFKSSGNHTVSRSEVNNFDPDRLIAWGTSTRFRFEPIEGWVDLYLRSNIKMSCCASEHESVVVLDSEVETRKSKRGGLGQLGCMVKSVYVPRIF